MSVLDRLSYFTGEKLMDSVKSLPEPKVTEKGISMFKSYLNISRIFEDLFEQTVSYNNFSGIIKDIKRADLAGDNPEDIYYAIKCGGLYYSGNTIIYPKLVYILKTALENNEDCPNRALLSINPATILKYCDGKSLPEGVTIKSIVEDLLGRDVSLMTSYRKLVKQENCYELYVPGVEVIALIPNDIGDKLTTDDVNEIEFKRGVGIMLGSMPLRLFNGRSGVTVSEFDLRKSE